MALWKKYGHERPNYQTYVKRMTDREKADKKLAKQIASAEKKRLREEAKMTKEFEKLDKDIILPKKKPINGDSPK
jgi:hypothetical protein